MRFCGYLIPKVVDYYYNKFKDFEGFKKHFFNFINEECNVKVKNYNNLCRYCWEVYSSLNEEDKKNLLYVFILYHQKIIELFNKYKFVEAKKILTKIKVNPEIFKDEAYYFDGKKFIIVNMRNKKIVAEIVNKERVVELCKYFGIPIPAQILRG